MFVYHLTIFTIGIYHFKKFYVLALDIAIKKALFLMVNNAKKYYVRIDIHNKGNIHKCPINWSLHCMTVRPKRYFGFIDNFTHISFNFDSGNSPTKPLLTYVTMDTF